MSTAVQVEIVIPESMGKVEALAKVSTSLQGVIARKRREWRASRGEIARPECRGAARVQTVCVSRRPRFRWGFHALRVGSECGKGHVVTVDE